MAGAKRITAAIREEFLDHIREGLNRKEAAEKVGLSGTAFRALATRDEAFKQAYEEAVAFGRPGFHDSLRHTWKTRALDGKSDRLLWYLIVSHLPEAAWFRGGKLEPTAESEPSVHDLSQLTTEELQELRRLVTKANADEARELARDGKHLKPVASRAS